MAPVIGVQVDGQIMYVDADAFGPQGPEDRSPIGSQRIEIQADHVQVIRVGNIAANGKRFHSRQLAESRIILSGDSLPPGHGGRQLGQLRDSQAHWMSDRR